MDKRYQDLLTRSLDASLSAQEQDEFRNILLKDDSLKREYDELLILRKELGAFRNVEFSSEFEDKVMDSIQHVSSEESKVLPLIPSKSSRFSTRYLATAASFLLLAAVATTMWFQPIRHVAENESISVLLPDGTKVELDEGSSLEYERFLMRSQRKVELDGHAFFEVAKNPAKPFLVQSFNAEIEVTGTKFDVNTRSKDLTNATVVFVKEGSVAVRTKANDKSPVASVELSANQQTTVLSDSKELSVSHVEDADKQLARNNGGFVFDNTKMSSVLTELEERFDIAFKAQSTDILERRLSYFEKDPKSLDQIVNDISHALGLNYTKSPEVIIFMYPNSEDQK